MKIVLVYRGCWFIKCRIKEGRLYMYHCIHGIGRILLATTVVVHEVFIPGVINLG